MLFRKKQTTSDVKNVAVFVDGPNIIRKEFNVNLGEIRRKAGKYGRIMIAKIFLNQYASEKLIEAIANQGFEPKIMLAGEVESDVDVGVAVEIVKAAYNRKVDIIALGSRDADYLPAVNTAKSLGKKVVVIAAEPGFSKALQHAADYIELLSVNKNKGRG